jgi:hypothetical protein
MKQCECSYSNQSAKPRSQRPRPYDYDLARLGFWQKLFLGEGWLLIPIGLPLFPAPTLEQCLPLQLRWEKCLRNIKTGLLISPLLLHELGGIIYRTASEPPSTCTNNEIYHSSLVWNSLE